jgi:glycosyltransferase involved in cell wall biosynthesis
LPFWSIAFALKRFTPVKILFICHNVVEHEANLFSRLAAQLVLSNGDYFIVQSEEEAKNLKHIFPFARVKICFLPSISFRGEKITKFEARKRLNIKTDRVILFFGFIRPYKGLKYLIEALPEVLREMDVLLLIAGEFWKKKEDYESQIARCNLRGKVKIADRYIPDEEVGIYFSAADIVVLPYVSVTGSGIVPLAFEQEKPVIVSDVGALAEIVEDNKTGFLVPPKDSQAIARAIVAFYKEDKDKEFIENVKKKRGKFSWEKMVEIIETFKDG